MTALAKLPADVANYYEGGVRAMIGGVPCRMPAWYRQRIAGKESIKALVAANEAIETGTLLGAPRFRFVPNEAPAPLDHGKPSGRGTVACRDAFKIASKSGWRPSRLSLDPMYSTAMTGDDDDMTEARKDWAQGNPKPLRTLLEERKGDLAMRWARIDACRALAAFARALAALPAPKVAPKVAPKASPCQTVSMKVSSPMSATEFRAIRESLDLSREELAVWLDVSVRTIFRHESGDAPIPKLVAQGLRLRASIANGDTAKALAEWAS